MGTVLEESKFGDIFGGDLAAPQNIVFNSMISLDRATFRLPRGGGKSFLLSTYAMLCAATTAESHISIIAPAYIQSKALFVEIDRFCFKSAYFKYLYSEKPVVGCDACYLRFKNGSTIKATPFRDIYSDNSNIILIDEANSVPDLELSELMTHIKNRTPKKVFLISTGYYNYKYINKVEADEHFSTLAFGYKAFPTGFFDQANIDEIKKTLTADVFDMDYNSKVLR